MSSIAIGLIGGTGKMGKQILQKICQQPGFHLRKVFSRQSIDIPEYTSNIEDVFKESSVVIDFSTTDLTSCLLEYASHYERPFISGVTGLNQSHYQHLEKASMVIPIVYDTNMSIGIVLLKRAASYFTKILDASFDRTIVEMHHRYKKDAPSGTSLSFAKCLSANNNLTKQELHSDPFTKCPQGSIAVSVIHAGGVLADQHIHFTSDMEQITLSHRCLDRGVYAEGALKAAAWIIGKEPKIYTMDDVLGLPPWIA